MADQRRWWKLWESSLSDDKILSLSPSDRWAWASFGAYTALHGSKGKMTIRAENEFLSLAFGCAKEDVLATLKRLPGLRFGEGKNDNGEITVSWCNWYKYQSDPTAYQRVKRSRARGEGKGREGKRREEKNNNPLNPPSEKPPDSESLAAEKTPRKSKSEKKAKPTNPSVKVVIDAYYQAFKARFGAPPPINGGLAGKSAKGLLAGRSESEAVEIVREYFADPPEWYYKNDLFGLEHVLKAAPSILAARRRND